MQVLTIVVDKLEFTVPYCSNLSNFNYKSQAESQQQHLDLYPKRHLRLVAIMIKETSCNTECTYFNLDFQVLLTLCLWFVAEIAAISYQV